jgi:hypothetical protein
MDRNRILRILNNNPHGHLMTVYYCYPETKPKQRGKIPQVAGIRLIPGGKVEIVTIEGYGRLKTIMLETEVLTKIEINNPYNF